MRPRSELHVSFVVALVVGRDGSGVNAAPDQAGAFPLLVHVPLDQFRAAGGDHPGVFVAVARGHQRGLVVNHAGDRLGSVYCVAVQLDGRADLLQPAFAAHESAKTQLSSPKGSAFAGASGPQWWVGPLQGFGQYLAGRDLKILSLVGNNLFRPASGQHLGKLLPHAAGVFQVAAVGGQLVGIPGTSDADIHPAIAEDVQGGHPRGSVQRMVDRRQNHADSQPDAGRTLADGRQGQVWRTVMRPHRPEVVLGKPNAVEALLLGVRNLLQRLPEPPGLGLGAPGFRDLYLIEQSEFHSILSAWLSLVIDSGGRTPKAGAKKLYHQTVFLAFKQRRAKAARQSMSREMPGIKLALTAASSTGGIEAMTALASMSGGYLSGGKGSV